MLQKQKALRDSEGARFLARRPSLGKPAIKWPIFWWELAPLQLALLRPMMLECVRVRVVLCVNRLCTGIWCVRETALPHFARIQVGTMASAGFIAATELYEHFLFDAGAASPNYAPYQEKLE